MAFLLAFSLAVFSIRWQASLLGLSELTLLLCIALFFLAVARYKWLKNKAFLSLSCLLAAGFCVGIAYSHFYAHQQLENRLPQAFWNTDVKAVIRVVSLPQEKSHARQFEARIESIDAIELQHLLGQKVLLKRYQQVDADINSCQRWSVLMRLKPVHGLRNTAGFDYQGFLFQQGLQIKGYIRSAEALKNNSSFCINAWRENWRSYLQTHFKLSSPDMAAWLSALSIGDKSLLSPQQRSSLQLSGSFHLFVISGLHIGLVAAAVYAFVLMLRKVGFGVLFQGDWRPFAALLALFAAVFYGLMAGWQLPVQRAVLTLFIFMSTSLLGLRWSLWRRFIVALFLVLLIQPMASLNPGFILSFVAVFFIILWQSFPWFTDVAGSVEKKQMNTLFQLVIFHLYKLLRIVSTHVLNLLSLQIALCLALMPFLLAFFQQWSGVMIMVNLIFIPIMGAVIIPLLLIAMVFWLVAQGTGGDFVNVSAGLLDFLAWCFGYMMPFLQSMINSFPFDPASRGIGSVGFSALLLAALLLLGPNILVNRIFALVLFFAVTLKLSFPHSLYWPFKVEAVNRLQANVALQLDVLDVGQGLSMLIQTPQHSLLYDTGASWQSSSMVQWVLSPVLRQYGLQSLDKVIISHTDNDHSGGLLPLMQQFQVKQLYAEASLVPVLNAVNNTRSYRCDTNVKWAWPQADFKVLHPASNYQQRKSNNRSCVLLISVAGRRILLTGDIEVAVEKLLLEQGLEKVDVLVVPHHGSKTSSSSAFLQTLEPKYGLISAGFMNRYRHPHQLVMARYNKQGVVMMNTAELGRIRLQVFYDGEIQLQTAAEDKLFYH